MNVRHVLVLERQAMIASDMRQEVCALDPEVRVRVASSVPDGIAQAQALGRVDLLIVSQRSAAFVEDPAFPRLTEAARSVMILGDEVGARLPDCTDVHVACAPFTSGSLRRDLMEITVAGAPLFPRRSPG